MSARPVDMATLLLVDPHARRIALARTSKGLITPQTPLQRGDGAGPFEAPTLSRKRLGASEAKATAFMDAAIRALYDDLGQLLAKPLSTTAPIPPNSPWARLARHHLQPDRTALTYLGRMIDPAESAHRRHVRVFAAPVSRISNWRAGLALPGRTATALACVIPGGTDETSPAIARVCSRPLGLAQITPAPAP